MSSQGAGAAIREMGAKNSNATEHTVQQLSRERIAHYWRRISDPFGLVEPKDQLRRKSF
jgi:hypothetical protein